MSEGPFVEIEEKRGRSDAQIKEKAEEIKERTAGGAKVKRTRLPTTHPDYKKIEKKSSVWEPWRQDQLRQGAGRSTEESSEESTG